MKIKVTYTFDYEDREPALEWPHLIKLMPDVREAVGLSEITIKSVLRTVEVDGEFVEGRTTREEDL